MANINDLKTNNNSTTIDLTGGSTKKPSTISTKTINTTSTKSIKLSNLQQPSKMATPIVVETDAPSAEEINEHKGKTVVKYDANKSVITAHNNKGKANPNPNAKLEELKNDTTNRQAININTLFPPKPDENIHESMEKDILEGEDSIFGKFLKEKQSEAEAWIAQKEEEKELKESEEKDLVDVEDTTNDVEEDIEYIPDNDIKVGNVVFDDEKFDEDIESENAMDENIEFVNDDDIIDTDDTIIDQEEDTTVEEEIEEDELSAEDEVDDNITDAALNEEVESNITSTESVTIYTDTEEDIKSAAEVYKENDDTTSTTDDEDIVVKLKRLASEKIKPVSEKLNIKSFTVVNKPTTNTTFLNHKQVKVAKWVLPNQESIVLMKQFIGLELEQLRDYSADTESYTSMLNRFEMIYDHIVSAKPTTYKAWLKATPYTDIDHYFFAIYIACYKGANYVPLDCPKCKEPLITDSIDIMSMVKFTDEKSKKKFYEIYQSEVQNINPKGLYVTEIVPLTENIAISFKTPSIYDLIMLLPLDDKFKTKYKDIINYIPFIDNMYIIDQQNQSLIPIGFKEYPESEIKTIKSRIVKYNNVLKSIDSDAFGIIKSYRAAIADVQEKPQFKYVYPAYECPNCKAMTNETEVTAEQAVFTRHQLGAFVTTTIN